MQEEAIRFFLIFPYVYFLFSIFIFNTLVAQAQQLDFSVFHKVGDVQPIRNCKIPRTVSRIYFNLNLKEAAPKMSFNALLLLNVCTRNSSLLDSDADFLLVLPNQSQVYHA